MTETERQPNGHPGLPEFPPSHAIARPRLTMPRAGTAMPIRSRYLLNPFPDTS